MRLTRTRPLLMAVALVAAVSSATAASGPPQTPGGVDCDQACLSDAMNRFVSAMTARRPETVTLTDASEVRENTSAVALAGTAWKDVKTVRSILTIADPLTGNVVSRAGVELADGKPAYISTRLKVVAGGRITDVEISADTSARVVGAYVWNIGAELGAVLPPEQRMARVALEALAARYFHSLSTHVVVAADFDPKCDRFHSGQRITNVSANTVEAGAARTCSSSLEGNVPWGPTTEARFPVIDVERGLVLGVTLLHYLGGPTPRQMYVSEVFKVVDGRIVRIDNIGLMTQGVATLGFRH